jgi:hypothetical protein
LGRSWNER